MLKNYLKVAWRNIVRDKSLATINIIGLAIGMAVVALITLWVQQELTFDRFYTKTNRIYEVYNRGDFNKDTWAWPGVGNPLSTLLKNNFPEFEEVVRCNPASGILTTDDRHLKSEGIYTETGFFNLFNFDVKQGNISKALTSQNEIVITETLAQKLFNTSDVIGRTIQLDSSDLFTITAVLKQLPSNSRFKDASYFLSWSYFEDKIGKEAANSWTNFKVSTFALLKPNSSVEQAESKIQNILIDNQVGQNQLFLHPATKWHLYDKAEHGRFTGGKITLVRMFILIALGILCIACINFVNLTTAKSEKRAREIGVRKVIGAQKHTLVLQFLSETCLLSIIAGILALLIVKLSIPFFNELLHANFTLIFSTYTFWLSAIGFILLTGFLAGLYPAFFLSSFQPIQVLNGLFKSDLSIINPRKALIIFQFTCTITLIVATMVIYQQINYAKNRESGYNKNNLIYIPLNETLRKHYENIRYDLINSDAANVMTRSSGTITQHTFGSTKFSWPGSTTDDLSKAFVALTADKDFQHTMGIKITEGRDIDIHAFSSDSTAMLLNQAAVKAMRLKNPIGTIVRNGEQKWHVVGVVKDFIFYSPYANINPLFILGSGDWFNFMYIKLNSKNKVEDNLALIKAILTKYDPLASFEYHFVDDAYEKNFENEQRTAALISLFTLLTVFIACLGLFGLVAFFAEERKKEISIRKVFGATIQSIFLMLSKEFIQLILIAFVIALPIAWWAMNNWLDSFAFRIEIKWWMFVFVALIAIVITLLTISFQTVKAALANPVDALRVE